MNGGPGEQAARRRQLALAVLVVGAVLLFSSVTWFSAGSAGVGVAQVVVALVVLGAGAALLRGSRRA